jgi:alkanesulfonate monooxygenase SsuD/methylene tetrahydromethanopterin reductase-like flavin-dependent oxidoreductase (luciferase family)
MKFQVLDIIPHLKNPLTGDIVSTADRLNQVVETARRAEELGFDSFSVGERHAGEFISSSPTTVLAAIAAVTDRIRLQSGVTVLAVLDPVRVAEDYATIDQLSRGRLELVIGKGNEVLQYPLFGLDLADQWDLLAEKYGLLRRLWREEGVIWSGRFRAPLTEPTTTTPRPFAGPPRIWHGSATTLTSAALAAKWGDPLFTANAIRPRENYQVLIDHYRDEYARHGHDLQSISLPTTLPFEQQLDILERFALEVIPAVRAAAPTTLWEAGDPYGSRPESAAPNANRSNHAYAH